LPTLSNTNYRISGVGDFNSDGVNDIVWRNAPTGTNALWLLDSAHSPVVANLPALPDSSYEVAGPR
jgi:hypothetical protein